MKNTTTKIPEPLTEAQVKAIKQNPFLKDQLAKAKSSVRFIHDKIKAMNEQIKEVKST